MAFKYNINLEDFCSLEKELDILYVENTKDNINSANISGMVKYNNVYKKNKKKDKWAMVW